MKPITHTVGQLLALADMASSEVERTRITQVYWSPHWVAATNGHRALLVSLPADPSRHFGLAATSLRRWLSGPMHTASERCTIEVEKGDAVGRVFSLVASNSPRERVLLRVHTDEFVPIEGTLPHGCLAGAGDDAGGPRRLQLPPPEKRVVTPHVIAPTYLEGVTQIGRAFGANRHGFELLSAPAPLDPILYGAVVDQDGSDDDAGNDDGVLLYLVMPMRPRWMAPMSPSSRAVH